MEDLGGSGGVAGHRLPGPRPSRNTAATSSSETPTLRRLTVGISRLPAGTVP
jgi:hypothetical protein